MPEQTTFQVKPFPKVRNLVIDAVRVGRSKPMMQGLIEIDVTKARNCLHAHQNRTGEDVSFTAFLLHCLGQALEEQKYIHAYRNWRGQLIVFDEVDCNVIIEITFNNQHFPLAHVIRAINRRSVFDIHEEIRRTQHEPQRDVGTSSQQRWLSLFLSLPGPLRRAVYRFVMLSPHLIKRYIGTVTVSAVGMFGKGVGWGIGIALFNFAVIVGGIARKPGVVDDRVEIREYLQVTLNFNHDIVDGGPAARFSARFRELMESAHGLSELG